MNKKSSSNILKKLLEEDQKDRKSPKLKKLSDKERWKIISGRDADRLKRLYKLLDKNPKLTGIDCFRVGIILQHAPSTESKEGVIAFAKKGIGLGNKKCRWLFAAGTDRLLMMQGKKQKFGTQYRKNSESKWELYPLNPRTTDKERAKYGVIPLKKIKERAIELNRDPQILSSKKIGISRR